MILSRLLGGIVTISTLFMPGYGASLEQIHDFGPNPGEVEMWAYVPNNVKSHPAVIVAVCARQHIERGDLLITPILAT